MALFFGKLPLHIQSPVVGIGLQVLNSGRRRAFAAWCRQAGTPTLELQRLGGWKTLEMVERYAHVAPEGLQIAASRVDNLFAVTNSYSAPMRKAPDSSESEAFIWCRRDESNTRPSHYE